VKKLISIFLLILFVATQLHVQLNTHYCMGMAKQEWSIGFDEVDCKMMDAFTNCMGESIHWSCCRNEVNAFQLNSAYESQVSLLLWSPFVTEPQEYVIDELNVDVAQENLKQYVPPLPKPIDPSKLQRYLI